MPSSRHKENWKLSAESLAQTEKEPPEFMLKHASVATKAIHLSFIKALLRAAAME